MHDFPIEWHFRTKSRQWLEAEGRIFIPCRKEDAWKLLSEPGFLTKVNCYVSWNNSADWSGLDSTDKFAYHNGREFTRRVIYWDERQGIGMKLFSASTLNNTNIEVYFRFSQHESGIQFSAIIALDAYRHVPRPIWPFLQKFILVPRYQSYLKALLYGYHQYLTTGVQVSPNQFGNLRHFS